MFGDVRAQSAGSDPRSSCLLCHKMIPDFEVLYKKNKEMKCRMDCLLYWLLFVAIQTNCVKAEAAQRRQLKSLYTISEKDRTQAEIKKELQSTKSENTRAAWFCSQTLPKCLSALPFGVKWNKCCGVTVAGWSGMTFHQLSRWQQVGIQEEQQERRM